jgi:hypothetical protein
MTIASEITVKSSYIENQMKPTVIQEDPTQLSEVHSNHLDSQPDFSRGGNDNLRHQLIACESFCVHTRS